MGMHETKKQGRKPGSDAWAALAHNYKAGVYDLLDPVQLAEFNELINKPNVWVQANDVTIHSMEKKGKIYAVVFYRSMIEGDKVNKKTRQTPRELLEDELEKKTKVKSVDED